jgi:hypothetical protein
MKKEFHLVDILLAFILNDGALVEFLGFAQQPAKPETIRCP